MRKKYTMKEFKEMFDKAKMEVLSNPTEGGNHGDMSPDKIAKMNFSLMLSGMIIFDALEKKLFKEEN